MSTISTFGTFTMARLGIYAATKGLNVTGNNITNINTPGYTRQAIDQKSMYISGADHYAAKYDQRIGNGALVTRVTQLRDPYLDIRYRNENAAVGSADAKLAGLDDIASVLDEVGKGDGDGELEAVLNDMMTQLENLVTQGANQDDYDTLMRSGSESVCGVFHMFAEKLQTLRDNEEKFFHQELQNVNGILTSIQQLNAQIRKATIHGSDALEERDSRNNLIDELSNYMKIRVKYVDEDLGGFTVEKLVIQLDGGDTVEPDEDPKTAANADEAAAMEERNKQRAARRAANDLTLIDGVYATQLSIRQVPEQAKDPSGKFLYFDGTKTTTAPADGQGHDYDPVRVFRGEDKKDIQVWKKPGTDDDDNLYVDEDKNVYTLDESTGVLTMTQKADGTTVADAPTFSQNMMDSPNLDLDLAPLVDLNGKRKVLTYASEPLKDNNGNAVTITATPDNVQEEFAKLGLPTTGVDEEYGYQLVKGAGPDADGKYTYTLKKITYGLSKTEPLYDNTLYGALQSERELLTECGEFCTAERLENDPDSASKRGYPYYQYALDHLARKYAEILNDANAVHENVLVEQREATLPFYEGQEVTGARIMVVKCLDPDGHEIMRNDIDPPTPLYLKLARYPDKDGVSYKFLTDETCSLKDDELEANLVTSDNLAILTPEQYAQFGDTSSPTGDHGIEVSEAEFKGHYNSSHTTYVDETVTLYGNNQLGEKVHTTNIYETKGGVLISNNGSTNDTDNIDASNISVSQQWSNGSMRIVASFEDLAPSTANDNLAHILTQFTSEEKHVFYPRDIVPNAVSDKHYFKGTYQAKLTDMWNVLANDTQVTTQALENYTTSLDELYVDRDGVSGVDLNDETMNMMQYQKAYSASCRLLTTIDEMLDKLINGTGRAGL